MSGYKGDTFTERLAERARLRAEVEEGQPAVLLRDTPEDRERLAVALRQIALNPPEPMAHADWLEWDEDFNRRYSDAIIAALRADASASDRGER